MQNGYGQDFTSGAAIQTGQMISARDIQERSAAILGAGIGAPQKAPPMDVSMRNLGQNIERLQQAVQVLYGKLGPVLYPEPPSPNTTQAVEARAPRASSGLGSTVNNFADQIESITDHVNQMVRRCEL